MKMQLNTNVDTDTTTIFDEDGSLGIELAPRKHGGAIIKEIKEGGLAEKNGCLRKAMTLKAINEMQVLDVPLPIVLDHLRNAPRPLSLTWKNAPSRANIFALLKASKAATKIQRIWRGRVARRQRLQDKRTQDIPREEITTVFNELGSLGIELIPRRLGGVMVKEIKSGGLADRGGILRKAMTLKLINGKNVINRPLSDIVHHLQSVNREEVSLTLVWLCPPKVNMFALLKAQRAAIQIQRIWRGKCLRREHSSASKRKKINAEKSKQRSPKDQAAIAKRKRERKRIKMKQIVRNQLAMQRKRARDRIDAQDKLRRVAKARINWQKRHALNEDALMVAEDPVALLQQLRAEQLTALHPSFRHFVHKERVFLSVELINPVFFYYDLSTKARTNSKAKYNKDKISELDIPDKMTFSEFETELRKRDVTLWNPMGAFRRFDKTASGFVGRDAIESLISTDECRFSHPAMPVQPRREVCNVDVMSPVFYTHVVQKKNPDEDPLGSEDEDPFTRKPPTVYQPPPPETKENLFCPICAALPKRKGLDGCPACYEHKYDRFAPLPWLRDPRSLPGIQQGFRAKPVRNLVTPPRDHPNPQWDVNKSHEYVEFVKRLRIRKKRNPPIDVLKPIKEKAGLELGPISYTKPVFRGAATSMYGDQGKTEDDENASFCMHTRLYSRQQIEIAREKRAARTLHIVIKTMPDDFNVHLYVDPHTCSCEDLNRLVVMNCKDYEIGMCSDGRFQSLVLVIPTVKGFYHIDMRTYPPKNLHGIDIYSLASNTVLEELKIGTRAGKEPYEDLVMIKVPILSNVAIPRLFKRYFAANIDLLHIDVNYALLENKMFEVHTQLPGDDPLQQRLGHMIFCQTRAKEEIIAKEKAKKWAERKAWIKRLKLEEAREAKEQERRAQRLVRQQEQEAIMKKAMEEDKKRREEELRKKKEAEAQALQELLAMAGRR